MDRFLRLSVKQLTLNSSEFSSSFSFPLFAWLIQMLFIRGFVYLAESVPVPSGSVGLNKTSVHTCRHKRGPLWCLLYKPLYKWVKHQDAGGLCTLEASPLFSHSSCCRDSSRRWDGGENDAPLREKCSTWLYNNVVLLVFLLCWMRLKPSQTSLLRPSASLPTDSSLTPLCRALPQATPRNYSPVPQTGEMGVCYTLHAELRKQQRRGHYLSIKPKAKKQNAVCHIPSPSLRKIAGLKSIVLI